MCEIAIGLILDIRAYPGRMESTIVAHKYRHFYPARFRVITTTSELLPLSEVQAFSTLSATPQQLRTKRIPYQGICPKYRTIDEPAA